MKSEKKQTKKEIKCTTGSTNGGGLLSADESQFFSKREIWQQVFGKDGRGGAIENLHDMITKVDKRVDEKFNELESMICNEFEKSAGQMAQIQSHLESYSDIKDQVNVIDETLTEHIDEWADFTEAIRTEEAVQVRLQEEHEKGVNEGDRIFNKRAKLGALYLTAAGIIIGALVRILFF